MAQIINLNARRPYRPPPVDVPVAVRNGWIVVRRPDGVLELTDPRLVRMEQVCAGEREEDSTPCA